MKNPSDRIKKIKVIHIITRFDKGGSAENTCLTVCGLDKSRYDILLIRGPASESSLEGEEERAVRENILKVQNAGVRIITLDRLLRDIRPVSDVRALFALISIFRDERPHLVHTHTSKAGILGRWAAFLSGVPVVIHTPHGHVFWGYSNRLVSMIYVLLDRWTARITDSIITLTDQEKQDHLKLAIAPFNKFITIHSGVDLDQLADANADPADMKRDLGIPVDAVMVGTAGRLTSVKGHRYLLEAAGKILTNRSDCYFLFLGNGELRAHLEGMAGKLGIEKNVRFLGWRPDVAEVMSAFDIFVFPSLNEGMGKAVVEAMALGKPVVASRIGGIIDLIRDGRNGILVPPADSKALSAGIERLLENPDERTRFGEESRKQALFFDFHSMVKKIDDLYSDFFS